MNSQLMSQMAATRQQDLLRHAAEARRAAAIEGAPSRLSRMVAKVSFSSLRVRHAEAPVAVPVRKAVA